MAIKLFRRTGVDAYAEIPNMLDFEPSSGEERAVETKSYISKDDDYEDFDVGTSSAPEFTITFDAPITDLENDYDNKVRADFGVFYNNDNLEVIYTSAAVTKRTWVKVNDKPRRQYTVKTAGKPTVNTPASVLSA